MKYSNRSLWETVFFEDIRQMIFYLVRHGQTDWNNEKRMQGHMDIPMNEEGIRQINELAEGLIKEGIIFNRLISSPLDRARKSAEIIVEKTGFKVF